MSLVTAIAESSPKTVHEREIARRVSPLRLALFPARIFLALGWTRAGVEKLIDSDWWNGAYLLDFLATAEDVALPFALWPTGLIGARLAIAVSVMVLLIELVLGFCLLTARHLRRALGIACGLNVVFVALGAVTPSAFYLVMQLTVLMAMTPQLPAASTHQAGRRHLLTIAGCGAVAVGLTPYIRTLHPHEVIEDPAIMLATLALLVAATLMIRLLDDHRIERSRFFREHRPHAEHPARTR